MNDSQLDQLLNSYGIRHAPPGFSSEVWNRIAAESQSGGWQPVWHQFLAGAFARLSRPTGALAAFAVFVIVGALAGFGSRPEAQPAELQYIRSVSPFVHPSNQ